MIIDKNLFREKETQRLSETAASSMHQKLAGTTGNRLNLFLIQGRGVARAW